MSSFVSSPQNDSGSGNEIQYINIVDVAHFSFASNSMAVIANYPYTFNVKKGDMLATPYFYINASSPDYNVGAGRLYADTMSFVKSDYVIGGTANCEVVYRGNGGGSYPVTNGIADFAPIKFGSDTQCSQFGNVIVATSDGTIIFKNYGNQISSVFQLRLGDNKQTLNGNSRQMVTNATFTFTEKSIIVYQTVGVFSIRCMDNPENYTQISNNNDAGRYYLNYPELSVLASSRIFGVSAGAVIKNEATSAKTFSYYTFS